MRTELTAAEAAFRMEWKKESYAPLAMLQEEERPGFRKSAAVFLRLSDIKGYEVFRYFAERAAAVVKRCALAYNLPWMGEISNYTAAPAFLIDDEGQHVQAWINVSAGSTPETYSAATVDALQAAAVWADTMRGSTNPELTTVNLRNRYPVPEYSPRLLSETEGEAIANRLLAQLRSHDGEGQP